MEEGVVLFVDVFHWELLLRKASPLPNALCHWHHLLHPLYPLIDHHLADGVTVVELGAEGGGRGREGVGWGCIFQQLLYLSLSLCRSFLSIEFLCPQMSSADFRPNFFRAAEPNPLIAIQTRRNPPTELQLISGKGMPIVGGKTVVLSKPRALPVIDLTLFGGGIGPKRYYKKEKDSIPKFIGTIEDQWHSASDNIVIKIGYKGHPEPMAQWFRGEEPLQNSRRIVITADGAYTELAIFDAQRMDGGFYTCRIENAMGVQEKGCHLFIREGGPSGTAGSGALRAYRSVLYTPTQRYSRF